MNCKVHQMEKFLLRVVFIFVDLSLTISDSTYVGNFMNLNQIIYNGR